MEPYQVVLYGVTWAVRHDADDAVDVWGLPVKPYGIDFTVVDRGYAVTLFVHPEVGDVHALPFDTVRAALKAVSHSLGVTFF